MISYTLDLYEALQELADMNGRPISWEARRILIEKLESLGLWPRPEGDK